jgi:hypothetical protein
MRNRNLLIKGYDIAFYAHGNDPWWHCHLFVNNAAAGTQPDPEIGGWDRNLSGRLYPIEIQHKFPLPERLTIDVEKVVRVEVQKAWEAFLKLFNQGGRR